MPGLVSASVLVEEGRMFDIAETDNPTPVVVVVSVHVRLLVRIRLRENQRLDQLGTAASQRAEFAIESETMIIR
jgi:hypothetical protein